MFVRPLVVSMAAILCGTLAAQSNAVSAKVFSQKIKRSAGETVDVDFGLKPLVHGPYTLTVSTSDAEGVRVRLHGELVFGPGLPDSTKVRLQAADTLQVVFYAGGPDASVTVDIDGWKYAYADLYPAADAKAVGKGNARTIATLDWRAQGAVTPVKNHGQCGSSSDFSTTGAVEGYTAIHGSGLPNLSEQQILDCGRAGSCVDGDTAQAFSYVHAGGGLTSQAAYPYTAREGTCKKHTDVAGIGGFVRVPIGDEEALMGAVNKEPVSVVLDGDWMAAYKGGVVHPDCEAKVPNYVSALIVGYGYDAATGQDYWLVKNSWGSSWGMQGYFEIARHDNNCGIADYAILPTTGGS